MRNRKFRIRMNRSDIAHSKNKWNGKSDFYRNMYHAHDSNYNKLG